MKAKPRTAPPPDEHKWRRQHEPVERVAEQITDADGKIGNPWRAIGLLAMMEARGAITPGMRAAGVLFHANFILAHLEPLRAADPGRVGGCGAVPVRYGSQAAKDAVCAALNALGGDDTLAGCCAWFVLGHKDSLTTWAARERGKGRNISTENASGILIGALDVLQRHFGC